MALNLTNESVDQWKNHQEYTDLYLVNSAAIIETCDLFVFVDELFFRRKTKIKIKSLHKYLDIDHVLV